MNKGDEMKTGVDVGPNHFLASRGNIESIRKGPGSVSWVFGCAYEVACGEKVRVTLYKEKALQIASEMLDCDGKVEIKRIELN